MGRASAMGSWPPCSIPRGSAAPIENSPPGIQAMPAGAGPGGAATAGTVAVNTGPAGAGVEEGCADTLGAGRLQAAEIVRPNRENTPNGHTRPRICLFLRVPTLDNSLRDLHGTKVPWSAPDRHVTQLPGISTRRRVLMRSAVSATLGAVLLAAPAWAQSPTEPWNGLPDHFQIDTGYFRIDSRALLRYQGGGGNSGQIDFENDLGVDPNANTYWVDASWRLGRRHQLKLNYTKYDRTGEGHTLQRDFGWGGQTFNTGLVANSTTGSDILGGYYRFALVRNERFEIGPTVGIGYLWLTAGIRATGTVTGPGGNSE